MKVAIDTNVLLAILYEDDYTDTSETELRRAYQEGRLVIAPIVYAEVAADGHFGTEPELNQFLVDFSIRVEEPSQTGLFKAGQQFHCYTERRLDGLQCPTCGSKQAVTCVECGEDLGPRQHIAADFVIGGHATADTDGLISFDTAFYQTYFPSLTVYPQSETA